MSGSNSVSAYVVEAVKLIKSSDPAATQSNRGLLVNMQGSSCFERRGPQTSRSPECSEDMPLKNMPLSVLTMHVPLLCHHQ